MGDAMAFTDLNVLAKHLRQELSNKKFALLYAHNGTGKTRLSAAFKDFVKVVNNDAQTKQRDTLYFNAFTEDLFSWDNDLEKDSERKLNLNAASSFFVGLNELEIENRIRLLLGLYADFDFKISFEFDHVTGKMASAEVTFSRKVLGGEGDAAHLDEVDGIKISRGEENIFIWCFFLAIVQIALDDDGAGPYIWVKYIYIDDPISSLDEHNAIAVANHLAKLLKRPESRLKTVISTHHTLFFNVLCNELNRANKYFLSRDGSSREMLLRKTGEPPFFHHVAALPRLINILDHGNYSLFEPQEMLEENKGYFRKILHDFINRYPFNPALFPSGLSPEMSDSI